MASCIYYGLLMNDNTKSLDTLAHSDWNPRIIDKHDFEALKRSMREFGDLSGVVKNIESGTLVGGNQRLEAFKQLPNPKIVIYHRMDDGPNIVGTVANGYIELDNGERFGYREVSWSLEREKAANVAANRIQGRFDLDALAQLTYELKEIDPDLLDLTGQTKDEIDSLLDSVGVSDVTNQEDQVPEVDTDRPAISQLGEIYQLGRHRLMCGDSLDFGQVSDLLDGADIDMVFTDPPYNASFNGRSGNHEVIENDALAPEEFKEFLSSFITNLYAIAPNATKYICTDWKMYPLLYGLMQKPSACIVWVKNVFGMGNGYRHQHELIVFEGKLEANDQSDVWEIKRDNGFDYEHPTQKPVAIPTQAIINSSSRDNNILDLFGGSGSTLMAADILERSCYMMELDAKYCDVIRKRFAKSKGHENDWQEFTPAINKTEVAPSEEMYGINPD